MAPLAHQGMRKQHPNRWGVLALRQNAAALLFGCVKTASNEKDDGVFDSKGGRKRIQLARQPNLSDSLLGSADR
jgi:hypothetical protein